MREIVVLALLALVAGCVMGSNAEGERTSYRCANGKEFSYRRVSTAIEVYASGQTHRLEAAGEGQYRSADGAVTFSESGGVLTGAYGGPFETCQRRTQLSRFF